MPVRMVRPRCSPSWGWWSAMRVIAWRMARSHRLERARKRTPLVDPGRSGQRRARAPERGSRVRRRPGRLARRPRSRVVARCRRRFRRGVVGTRSWPRSSIWPASPSADRDRPALWSLSTWAAQSVSLATRSSRGCAGRVGEEPGEVVHAAEVAQVDDVPVEAHRPVVALTTKADDAPTLLVERIAVRDVGCPRRAAPTASLDSVGVGAGRSALQVGALMAAAGMMGVSEAGTGMSAPQKGAPTSLQPSAPLRKALYQSPSRRRKKRTFHNVGGAGDQRFALEPGSECSSWSVAVGRSPSAELDAKAGSTHRSRTWKARSDGTVADVTPLPNCRSRTLRRIRSSSSATSSMRSQAHDQVIDSVVRGGAS